MADSNTTARTTTPCVVAPPAELVAALAGDSDGGARTFFDALPAGYKRRYCDWVSRSRYPDVREARAQWAVGLLRKKQKKLTVGSFMGDVRLNAGAMDDPVLRGELHALCEEKSHMAVSRYAELLAAHIMDMAGATPDGATDGATPDGATSDDATPDGATDTATDTALDSAMYESVAVNRRWRDGAAAFQEARDAADVLMAMARVEKDPIKVKVLRVLSHVAATPHVKRHALIASDYAIALVNLLRPSDTTAATAERKAQIEMLKNSC